MLLSGNLLVATSSPKRGPVPRPPPVMQALLLDRDAALHPWVDDTQVEQGPAGGRGDPSPDGLVERTSEQQRVAPGVQTWPAPVDPEVEGRLLVRPWVVGL